MSERTTCFISAPFGVDTIALREELKSQKIDWVDITTAPFASTVLETIRGAIRQSDFVCAVLPRQSVQQSNLVEIGIAIGSRTPVLLIADRGTAVPFDISELPTVRSGIDNKEAIRFQLENFLKTLKTKRVKRQTSVKAKIGDGQRKSKQIEGKRGEADVAKLLMSAGFLHFEAPKAETSRADFIAWVDDLIPAFSSPIVCIEVKGSLSRLNAKETAEKLKGYVAETGAGVGLVVYRDFGSKTERRNL